MKKIAVIILCYILPLVNAGAQTGTFINYNIQDGLAQSQALSLCKDSLGKLWVGTMGGLSCYDGYGFKNYFQLDGLPGNIVYEIIPYKNGGIAAATERGIVVFYKNKFISLPKDLTKNWLSAKLFGNNKNEIFILLKNKIYKASKDFSKWEPLSHTIKEKINAVESYSDDNFIIATETSLIAAELSLDGKGLGGYRNLAKGQKFYYIKKQNNTNAYYVIGEKKIILINGEQKIDTLEYTEIKKHIKRPNSIYLSGSKLWALSAEGLYSEDYKNNAFSPWQDYETKTSSKSSFINFEALGINTIMNGCIADKEGNLWIATDGQGIYKYNPAFFTKELIQLNRNNLGVMALASLKGELLVGSYGNGLYKTDAKGNSKLVFNQPELPKFIMSMSNVNDEYVWIGSRGQKLWKYDGKKIEPYAENHKIKGREIAEIFKDSQSRYWIATTRGFGFIKNETYFPRDSSSFTWGFCEIGKDSVAIATDSKILIYNEGKIKNNEILNALVAKYSVTGLFYRSPDQLWLATNGQGLVCCNLKTGKEQLSINSKNSRLTDFIYFVSFTNNNELWVGTGNGVANVKLEYKNNDLSRPFLKEAFVANSSQGLPGYETNKNACYVYNSKVYFGTTQGLFSAPVSYRPEKVNNTNIFIDQIFLGYKNRTNIDTVFIPKNADTLKVNSDCNALTFFLNNALLNNKSEIKYVYKIDNQKSDWTNLAANRLLQLTNLDPGYHVIHFKSVANKTMFADIFSLTIFIEAAYYQTLWFKTMIVALLVGIGYLIKLLADNSRRKNLAAIETIRTEEQLKIKKTTAEDFHDELGNRITRINILTNILEANNKTIDDKQLSIIKQIQENAQQLYSGTSEIIWSLQNDSSSLFELINRINEFGISLFNDTNIDFHTANNFNVYRNISFSVSETRNISMILKECLNNDLKHSKAKNVFFEVEILNDKIQFKVYDNGVGFDSEVQYNGNGLKNIKIRAQRINADIVFTSRKNEGSQLILTVSNNKN